MYILKNLTLPLSYSSGTIVDGSGQTIIKANRDSNTTPLHPYQRDAILKLVCELLNEAFQYDKADLLLKKLGY